MRVHVEDLGRRQYLSSAQDISLSAEGLLQIHGSSDPDIVMIRRVGRESVAASINGIQKRFEKARVARVQLFGGAGNDSIANGTDIPCLFFGEGGNDTLLSGYGHDSLIGGTGDDRYVTREQTGSEPMIALSELAGAIHFTYTPSRPDLGMVIETPSGTETVIGGAGATLGGSSGDDEFTGTLYADSLTLDGGMGDDVIDVSTGLADDIVGPRVLSPILVGGRGSDRIYNRGVVADGGEAPRIFGGAGNDVIYDSAASDQASPPDGGDGYDAWDASSSSPSGLITIPRSLEKFISPTGGTDTAMTIIGSDGPDLLVLQSGGSIDEQGGVTVFAAGGNDTIVSGLGSDDIHGGSGIDTADYSARNAAITVSIDGIANDGAVGERDNIESDLEVVIGGSGDDSFVGSSKAETFYGGNGNDSAYGAGGNDYLVGGAGNDWLRGGSGIDTLSGGGGSDRLDAFDSNFADIVSGGAGNDRARVDMLDMVDGVETFL